MRQPSPVDLCQADKVVPNFLSSLPQTGRSCGAARQMLKAETGHGSQVAHLGPSARQMESVTLSTIQ